MKEPDLIQDSVPHTNYCEVDFGANFKKLRITDNVRELQTVLRDKYARGKSWFCPPFLCMLLIVDNNVVFLLLMKSEMIYINYLNKMSNF